MKKWLIPLAYPFVTVIVFLLSGAIGALSNGDSTGYGGLIITLIGLIFYCAIVIPAMCILYSKYCLSGQRLRFPFTLYQSFWIGLPCFITCIMSCNIGSIACSFALFAWCEAWGLVGLMKPKQKEAQ